MSPMRRVAVYLAVTFGLAWALWIGAGVAAGSFADAGASPIGESAVMMAAVALGMCYPLVGALVANALVPRDQRKALGLRPRVRGSLRLYLATWLVLGALSLLGAAAFFLAFPALLDPSAPYVAARFAQTGGLGGKLSALVALTFIEAFTFAPFVNMLFTFGEEAGWRGFLLPVLCERMSPRVASLVVGVVLRCVARTHHLHG